MKKLTILFLFLLACNSNSKVIILFVDPNISTIFAINKLTFNSFFGDEINIKKIDQSVIEKAINDLKRIEDIETIDARGLIIIGKDTLEVNKFYIKRDKYIYSMDKELYKIIWSKN